MEDEPILREAVSRYDAAMDEARRLGAFIHMYAELRKRPRPNIGRGEEFLLERPRTPARPAVVTMLQAPAAR